MGKSFLTSIPLEIFNRIVFELTCLEPLGPPTIIIPLMQTCRSIYEALLSDNNRCLYSMIYRHKFDVSAVMRRAFDPTPMQCILQLRRILAAMRLFRSGDIYVDKRQSQDDGLGLNEALNTAFVMMLDDDGRNAVQLLLWARADVFIRNFVARRLYEGFQYNDGWPLDGENIAHALWVMWLLTSEGASFRVAHTNGR